MKSEAKIHSLLTLDHQIGFNAVKKILAKINECPSRHMLSSFGNVLLCFALQRKATLYLLQMATIGMRYTGKA